MISLTQIIIFLVIIILIFGDLNYIQAKIKSFFNQKKKKGKKD